MINDTVYQDALVECRDDYVGLWSLLRRVKASEQDQSKWFAQTLELVSRLLREGDVIAGTFHGYKFNPWQMSIDQTLEKVATDWRNLGRDPTIGDIAEFTTREGLG